jgi:hypothetical protein
VTNWAVITVCTVPTADAITPSYGDTAHLHAATAIGPSGGTATWTAIYDAAGNTACRASTSAKTCAGATTPNGPLLIWDNEGRLTAWQNDELDTHILETR